MHLLRWHVHLGQGVGPPHQVDGTGLGVKRVPGDQHLTRRAHFRDRHPQHHSIRRDSHRGGVSTHAADYPQVSHPANMRMTSYTKQSTRTSVRTTMWLAEWFVNTGSAQHVHKSLSPRRRRLMMVIITILVLCIHGKGDFNSIYLSICHVPSGVTQQRTLETVQQLDMKLLYMAGKLQHGL